MIKHTFRITLGVILVLIGIIGGLIPIFQGWIFGIPGLIILAEYFPQLKKYLIGQKINIKKATRHIEDCFVLNNLLFDFSLFWFEPFLV